MLTFDIMFKDLTPKAQAELCKIFKTAPDEENWDSFPIAVIEREEDTNENPVIGVITSREAVIDSIRHWQFMVDTAKTCDDASIPENGSEDYFDEYEYLTEEILRICGHQPSAHDCSLCNEIKNDEYEGDLQNCDNCILAHFFDDCSKPKNAYRGITNVKTFTAFVEKAEAMVEQLVYCLEHYDEAIKK